MVGRGGRRSFLHCLAAKVLLFGAGSQAPPGPVTSASCSVKVGVMCVSVIRSGLVYGAACGVVVSWPVRSLRVSPWMCLQLRRSSQQSCPSKKLLQKALGKARGSYRLWQSEPYLYLQRPNSVCMVPCGMVGRDSFWQLWGGRCCKLGRGVTCPHRCSQAFQ